MHAYNFLLVDQGSPKFVRIQWGINHR